MWHMRHAHAGVHSPAQRPRPVQTCRPMTVLRVVRGVSNKLACSNKTKKCLLL